ncbi:MAG: hypothetical protein AMDU1_APLC00032G0035 [Thermoplasmatales archaeon A-plasma]|jgi:rubrerythrin|nr:MAG: hypothetical protein AMDU1_APLC00059G0004 [Thermoplasmatales archaeon A-plasma]EQB71214.1 MAG: hypothetical protein AMDU1_APLC00032G0035 [Thermoplasmatales archaeon A-plasma]
MSVIIMGTNEIKKINTISGKSFEEVRNQLLRRTIRLKERVSQRYEELYNQSMLDHVKKLLDDLKKKESEDIRLIRKAMETGTMKMGTNDSTGIDYGMLDHILSSDLDDPNPNDLGSVLLSAIKMSNDLQKVLSIMSEEYKGPSSSNVFRKLAEHETENKNRLSEIYDEMINKDYW